MSAEVRRCTVVFFSSPFLQTVFVSSLLLPTLVPYSHVHQLCHVCHSDLFLPPMCACVFVCMYVWFLSIQY